MAQLLGRAEITINGKIYNTKPGATLRLPGVQRNEQEGDREIGYTEKLMSGELKCTIPFAKGDSIVTLRDLEPGTVVFKADTGQSYVMSKAVRMGDPPMITAGDGGDVEMTFMSNQIEETLS